MTQDIEYGVRFPDDYRTFPAYRDLKFNCFILDPPYFGKKHPYPTDPCFSNKIDYQRWLHDSAATCREMATPDAVVWFFGYWPNGLYMVPPAFENEGWKFVQEITISYYNSKDALLNRNHKHHQCFRRTSESILLFRLPGAKSVVRNVRKYSNVWRIKKTRTQRGSPAVYPGKKEDDIIRRILVSSQGSPSSQENPSSQGSLSTGKLPLSKNLNGLYVLDPMAGSGTTLLLCEELGISCRSTELRKRQCVKQDTTRATTLYESSKSVAELSEHWGRKELAAMLCSSEPRISNMLNLWNMICDLKYQSSIEAERQLDSHTRAVIESFLRRVRTKTGEYNSIPANLCYRLASCYRCTVSRQQDYETPENKSSKPNFKRDFIPLLERTAGRYEYIDRLPFQHAMKECERYKVKFCQKPKSQDSKAPTNKGKAT